MRALFFLAFVVIYGCSAPSEPESAAAADTAVDTDQAGDSAPTVDTARPPEPASCTNGTRDGDETDVDCGGAACGKCSVGRTCLAPADCASTVCNDAMCMCALLDDCPSGQSCVSGSCVAPLASCAAIKTASPTAKDGEYWIKPATGAAYRAYCDMARSVEICNEAGTKVTGRTREGAALTWTAFAKLNHAAGLCELWALASPTNYPFAALQKLLGQTLSTCQAFGFVADGTLGSCLYGSSRTNCGFTATTLNRYGNACTGCTTNPGSFKNYTLQGPISSTGILSNVSGTIKTTCKVR